MKYKAANSNYFCLWCTIHKNQNGDKIYDWNISKNITDVYNNCLTTPGHIYPLLFLYNPIITLDC